MFVALGPGGIDRAIAGIVDAQVRGFIELIEAVRGQADPLLWSQQAARFLHRHVVLPQVHPARAQRRGHLDIVIHHQRDAQFEALLHQLQPPGVARRGAQLLLAQLDAVHAARDRFAHDLQRVEPAEIARQEQAKLEGRAWSVHG